MWKKITTQSSQSKETAHASRAQAGTEFGIPNVLSLLKINLGGSASTKRGQDASQQREAERYHTYGSLTFRLREALMERGLVKRFDGTEDSWNALRPMDFVEFQGILMPNPFTDSMKGIDRFASIYELVVPLQAKLTGNAPVSGQGRHRQPNQTVPSLQNNPGLEQIKATRKVLQGLVEEVEKSDIRIVVADLKPSGPYRAVAAIFTEYLRDPSMTELSRKQYRILGRVVGKTSKGDEFINLLEGTGLSALPNENLDQLSAALQIGSLPKPETRIAAPAAQLLPIAIYV